MNTLLAPNYKELAALVDGGSDEEAQRVYEKRFLSYVGMLGGASLDQTVTREGITVRRIKVGRDTTGANRTSQLDVAITKSDNESSSTGHIILDHTVPTPLFTDELTEFEGLGVDTVERVRIALSEAFRADLGAMAVTDRGIDRTVVSKPSNSNLANLQTVPVG